MEKGYTATTIRIENPLYEKLKSIAAYEDRSIAKTITQALKLYVDKTKVPSRSHDDNI